MKNCDSKENIRGIVVSKEKLESIKSANEIIEDAKKKAKNILDSTYQKISDLEHDGFQKGYSDGFKKFLSIISQANQYCVNLERKYENDLKRLAVKISEKILKSELQLSPEHIVKIVKELLNQKKRERYVTVYLSHEDYNNHKNVFNDMKTHHPLTCDLTFCPNDKLSPGDCILELPNGFIDAKIDVQLNRIEELLISIEHA